MVDPRLEQVMRAIGITKRTTVWKKVVKKRNGKKYSYGVVLVTLPYWWIGRKVEVTIKAV